MPRFRENQKEMMRQQLRAAGIAIGSNYSFYQNKEHLYMDIAGNRQMRMRREMDEFLYANRFLPPFSVWNTRIFLTISAYTACLST